MLTNEWKKKQMKLGRSMHISFQTNAKALPSCQSLCLVLVCRTQILRKLTHMTASIANIANIAHRFETTKSAILFIICKSDSQSRIWVLASCQLNTIQLCFQPSEGLRAGGRQKGRKKFWPNCIELAVQALSMSCSWWVDQSGLEWTQVNPSGPGRGGLKSPR